MRKRLKCSDLVAQARELGQVYVRPIEMGARGSVAKLVKTALKR